MQVNSEDAAVIVIEDNADNLFIVTDLLQHEVRVRYCNARASGRQFFALIEKNPQRQIDLILLDIQLPYEDGYAVLRQIKANPAFQKTSVVAFTANVLPQDVERARSAGFTGFIGKPVDDERFPEQIRRILAGEPVWEPR